MISRRDLLAALVASPAWHALNGNIPAFSRVLGVDPGAAEGDQTVTSFTLHDHGGSPASPVGLSTTPTSPLSLGSRSPQGPEDKKKQALFIKIATETSMRFTLEFSTADYYWPIPVSYPAKNHDTFLGFPPGTVMILPIQTTTTATAGTPRVVEVGRDSVGFVTWQITKTPPVRRNIHSFCFKYCESGWGDDIRSGDLASNFPTGYLLPPTTEIRFDLHTYGWRADGIKRALGHAVYPPMDQPALVIETGCSPQGSDYPENGA